MTNSSQDDDFVVVVLCGLFEKKIIASNFFLNERKNGVTKNPKIFT
jgi:hypothetical protein